MPSLRENILVVGPSWVGDMVMSQSLFKVLRKLYPDCVIDVLAPAWSQPILKRMPEVQQSIEMPVGHGSLQLAVRYRLGKSLRKRRYTWSIVLPNSLKSAFVPYFAKIPRRTGWRGEWRYGWLNDVRKLDKAKLPLMVERFTALAYSVNQGPPETPFPALVVNKHNAERLRQKYQLFGGQAVLALCPGAEFGPAKQWPESHYATLAAEKIKQGWQVWIFGSDKDEPVAQAIHDLLSEKERAACFLLAGKTALAEAVDLLSLASAVVSNDSGLMHIAAALSVPVVAIYGSTSPTFTPPLSEQVKVVTQTIECAPCFQRECPKGHLKCLVDLSPSQVLAAMTELTDSSKVASRSV